jgi:hypothetical protein
MLGVMPGNDRMERRALYSVRTKTAGPFGPAIEALLETVLRR